MIEIILLFIAFIINPMLTVIFILFLGLYLAFRAQPFFTLVFLALLSALIALGALINWLENRPKKQYRDHSKIYKWLCAHEFLRLIAALGLLLVIAAIFS